ncbi:uncharacterized protein LOC117583689 [Drosophila guanche]|uniref:Uncharacterized protein n=1 Tax=Drosophila guanche TaxID=7266 RepID=A0A3B0JG62_DROGU|nr:uncharacterized protein LOC117583689 [Drosophila guanche]SPP81384.1 Hypothetical predicted protein [Drosophila guanche]
MSLASIKQKEAKGKKKVLPKLRNILANPYKQHSPVLREDELLQLRQILIESIKRSPHPAKTFATHNNIHLGLESSLRAINSRRFSCVFVSLSLRPSHIIRLIATSAATQLPTAPIYAQPKLEELTFDVFGVRALCLVLPLDLAAVSLELEHWVKDRQKPAPQNIPVIVKKSSKNRQVKIQDVQPEETAQKAAEQHAVPVNAWSDDYITFSSDKSCVKVDRVDAHVETQQLGAALSNLAMKAKSKATEEVKVESRPTITESVDSEEQMEVEAAEATDEDDFLPSDKQHYRPVSVHRVRPNPDKKPKKKRNKKQKQQPPSTTK